MQGRIQEFALGETIPSPFLISLHPFPEPRPKTNVVHSKAVRKPLVAIVFSILKCVFHQIRPRSTGCFLAAEGVYAPHTYITPAGRCVRPWNQ